ncbi:MAG: TMEM175 family protein [Rhodothermales bacterium]
MQTDNLATDQPKANATRLETFSDGVFAFSATLLVVSLEVPNSFPELLEDLRGFIGFGLRFGVLLSLWSVHHAYFRRYDIADTKTIVLNACLLFVILFYIYPLKFMSEGIVGFFAGSNSSMGMTGPDDLSLIFMLYSGGFVAIFLFVALMYRHAYSKRVMLNLSLIQEKEAAFYARHYAILATVGVFSVIMAALQIGIRIGAPGYVYMILGPLCYWHGRRHTQSIQALTSAK